MQDVGAGEQIDLNFLIEVKPGVFYPPVIYSAALGDAPIMKIIIANRTLELNVVDEKTGCNAFWFASLYGRAECMTLLAEAGINILGKHKDTESNALHVAMERKHYNIVQMLVQSNYPLDEMKKSKKKPKQAN